MNFILVILLLSAESIMAEKFPWSMFTTPVYNDVFDVRKVLIVSVNGTCRAPLAAAIFRKAATEVPTRIKKWIVHTTGLNSIHDGESPDPRVVDILKEYNLSHYLENSLARRFEGLDLDDYEFIFAMDQDISTEMAEPKKAGSKTIQLGELGGYDPEFESMDILPIYDAEDKSAFKKCYVHCNRSIYGFLNHDDANQGYESSEY